MKITDLTVTIFAWDNIPARSYARHTGTVAAGSSEVGLVTISTDQGVQGHSFFGTNSRGAYMDATTLIRALKPLVVGQNPWNREEIFQKMWARNLHTTARCIGAIDIALWDLCGKMANLPIYKMLGAYRSSIPAYSSSEVLPSKEAYVEEALRIKEAGFHGYKIHPPTNYEEDIVICRDVRKAVGDDYRLMLDPSLAYNYIEALQVGKALEDLNYYWYEDPMDCDDLTNYVKLRQMVRVPILATERSYGGFQAMAPWIMYQATDFLRGDVAIKGGITPLVKIANLAEAFHMTLEVHHGGNSTNNFANLHVILSIPNSGHYEFLLPPTTQNYGVIEDIKIGKDGHVRLPNPDAPGLGAEIDFGLIEKKKLAVLK